jgi:hypothetical protein
MKTSENLDAWSSGGWGVFIAPQPPTSRWGRLMSMGAPDSPLRRHVTQPLGFWSSWPLEALSSCSTGQVMFTIRCASDFCSDFCRALFAYCSVVRVPLQSTVALDSHCSAGAPDSSVAHRTVRWIIAEGTWRNPRVAGLSCMVLAHRTVRCAVPQSTLVSFAPLYLIPNLSIYWFVLNLYALVEHIF